MKHFFLLLTLLGMLPGIACAQQDEFDKNPAAKVVRQYLNHILQREWEKSASLVEPKSLETLLNDYVARVKRAPTMDDERAMCKRVDKSSPEQIAEMKPAEFYIAYHKGIQDKYNISDEMIKTVTSSLKLRLLAIAEEDAEHSHVLVRTKHSNGKVIIENLELISVVKVDGAWKVGLNEQTPRISKDPAAGTAESGKDTPKEGTAPATPPVKPVTPPKPATGTAKKPDTKRK